MTKFLSYVSLVVFAALLIGCASQSRFISDAGAESDWNRAKNLFERERYYRASQLLRDITLNYSGSAFIDSAYYYLALSGYERQDYFVASDDFRRLVQQFPSSVLAGNAAYFEARCNYEMAPDFRLDQTFTEQAFDQFQRYLEDFPQNTYADSAYKYMAKCRDKLAQKRFMALKLYLKLEEYASAVIYSEAILADYYDTKYADEAAFDKVRSLVKLKENEKAVAAIIDYRRRFPSGKFLQRVQTLENGLQITEQQAVTP